MAPFGRLNCSGLPVKWSDCRIRPVCVAAPLRLCKICKNLHTAEVPEMWHCSQPWDGHWAVMLGPVRPSPWKSPVCLPHLLLSGCLVSFPRGRQPCPRACSDPNTFSSFPRLPADDIAPTQATVRLTPSKSSDLHPTPPPHSFWSCEESCDSASLGSWKVSAPLRGSKPWL